MKKKRKITIPVICILVIVIMLALFGYKYYKFRQVTKEAEVGVKALIAANQKHMEPTELEAKIQALDAASAAAEKAAEELEAGKGSPDDLYNTMVVRDLSELRPIFKESIIAGDSIVEDIKAYSYLSEERLVYKRGVSVAFPGDMTERIIAKKPKYVFLTFGLNDLSSEPDDSDAFVKGYSAFVDEVQVALPDTKIFVNSILPIQQFAIDAEPDLAAQPDFNKALQAMCETKGIHFIDNTTLIEGHDELYTFDGMHPEPEYYPMWLTHMANEAELF
ncbi:MAG: GDSL-type esterase/lipase family protein [Lachnospiraceae bacterium]|nr:GDSL-type esterase/lipase family protein [Lachnospiraceae bacterium]